MITATTRPRCSAWAASLAVVPRERSISRARLAKIAEASRNCKVKVYLMSSFACMVPPDDHLMGRCASPSTLQGSLGNLVRVSLLQSWKRIHHSGGDGKWLRGKGRGGEGRAGPPRAANHSALFLLPYVVSFNLSVG